MDFIVAMDFTAWREETCHADPRSTPISCSALVRWSRRPCRSLPLIGPGSTSGDDHDTTGEDYRHLYRTSVSFRGFPAPGRFYRREIHLVGRRRRPIKIDCARR